MVGVDISDDERSRCYERRCGEPERARPPGILAPERAQRERHHRVRDHGRGGDEADELLPAGKREEEDQAADKRERDREERRSSGCEPGERAGDISIPAERLRQTRTCARVKEAGAAGRDDRVRVEQDREPTEP